jgi:hypothetical protein
LSKVLDPNDSEAEEKYYRDFIAPATDEDESQSE